MVEVNIRDIASENPELATQVETKAPPQILFAPQPETLSPPAPQIPLAPKPTETENLQFLHLKMKTRAERTSRQSTG